MDDPIGKFLGKGNVICHVQTQLLEMLPRQTLSFLIDGFLLIAANPMLSGSRHPFGLQL